jgi:ubiquinone/menaquinone biosynthesis C-methylase UbiE
MIFSPPDWQRRYIQQAAWTKELRQYLYQQADLSLAQYLLDVGCGPGALEPELSDLVPGQVIGLDLDSASLHLAKTYAQQCSYLQGDALLLPFKDRVFDVCLCHFVLLWLSNPVQALREMRRVTKSSGWLFILAEPDYSGRLDYPVELEQLGTWQQQSLIQQGAEPAIGRRLASLIQQIGLIEVHTGVMGGQWTPESTLSNWSSEWEVLENDLASFSIPPQVEEVSELRELDHQASMKGERILYVPTFYTWGKVP